MPLKPALLGAACALALASPAHAITKGWYVELEGGANWVADTDVDLRSTSAGLTTFVSDPTAGFDTGWAVVATLGYAFQSWRVEAEVAWRTNDMDDLTGGLLSTGSLDGLTAMYNMTYEFPLGSGVGIAVGAGAGVDYAMLDTVAVDDSDLNFAYQGIAQLNVALSTDTELTLAYRYLHVLDSQFEERSNPGVVLRFDDFQKHAVTLGIRYTFGP